MEVLKGEVPGTISRRFFYFLILISYAQYIFGGQPLG